MENISVYINMYISDEKSGAVASPWSFNVWIFMKN